MDQHLSPADSATCHSTSEEDSARIKKPGPLIWLLTLFYRLCSGYRPTETDLPANESGSSSQPIQYYESEQMKEYLKKIIDIWTFQVLEKVYCTFIKWKKFLQGLPSTHFGQWDNFLNRYPDLKNLVGRLKEDLGSQRDEYSKIQNQIQHEREKAETEANKLLKELKEEYPGAKKFCGLETSPLNLETRQLSKDRSEYPYEPNVRENLRDGFPGLLENVYCCPGLDKIKKKDNRKNKKGNQDNECKGVIMVVNRYVRMFQILSPMKNPMIILPNYYFENILKYVKGIKVSRQNGEFDIIIVSKKYSCFIVVEIKACKENSTNLKRDIFKGKAQLFKYRTIIQETFRDRPDILEFPVYDSIAIPFVDKGTLKKKLSEEFENMKILSMDDLKDDKAFTDWFGRFFPQVGHRSSMDNDQYYTVVERFAGIGSKVDKNSSQMKFKQEDIVNSKQLNLRAVFRGIRKKLFSTH